MDQVAQSLAWRDVATWAFCAGWSAIGLFVANSLRDLSKSVAVMKDSVGDLNTHVAVVIERVGNHEKRIEKLEERP